MKFVAIADTHGCHNSVLIPLHNKIDILIFAGDFCKDSKDLGIDFLDWFAKHLE